MNHYKESNFLISFQDLALNLRGSHVEAKANIFALEALVTDRIRSHINNGLFLQSAKNISLSAAQTEFQKSSLILGIHLILVLGLKLLMKV